VYTKKTYTHTHTHITHTHTHTQTCCDTCSRVVCTQLVSYHVDQLQPSLAEVNATTAVTVVGNMYVCVCVCVCVRVCVYVCMYVCVCV